MPLVSVIMCSYNHEDHVGEAIRSVLGQSHDDWEMLIVDDASSDRTYEVAKSFTDERIVCIRQSSNQGFGAAYNLALTKIRGTVVMNLGSDDAFHSSKMARQVSFLDENPEVGVVGTYITTKFEDWTKAGDPVSQWFNQAIDLNDPKNWIWRNHLAQSSAAVRRDVHDRLGKLNVAYPRTLDWDLWLRALCLDYKFHVLPEQLTFHRVVAGSVTHGDRVATGLEYMDMAHRYLLSWLRQTGREDLIQELLLHAMNRYERSDGDDRTRLEQGLRRLLMDAPESVDLLLWCCARVPTSPGITNYGWKRLFSRLFTW